MTRRVQLEKSNFMYVQASRMKKVMKVKEVGHILQERARKCLKESKEEVYCSISP